MRRLIQLALLLYTLPAWGTNWYVRSDGGTQYWTGGGGNTVYGMCNGKYDASYASVGGLTNATWLPAIASVVNYEIVDQNGNYEKVTTAGTSGTTFWPSFPSHGGGTTGVTTTTDGTVTWTYEGVAPYDQNCAMDDARFLFNNQGYNGIVTSGWIIAGGDTVTIRGCYNPDENGDGSTSCRIGASPPTRTDYWCVGGSITGCSPGPLPAGTAAAPTQILGNCVGLGTCHTGNQVNLANLTEIFGGDALGTVLNLSGAQYVTVQGFSITDHSPCVTDGQGSFGTPYPYFCTQGSTGHSGLQGDYATNGISTSNTTSNLVMEDLWVHGFPNQGLYGPIGGPITMTRMQISFNGFIGYNFDDGSDTPDAAGSSITASYILMEGNGCNEQYPIVNSFPAMSCYDLYSGGFGDSWSGQDTTLASFTCDHCQSLYNTKDGFIGPHTFITNLSITNGYFMGNQGQQLKFGADSFLGQNNLIVGNCAGMAFGLIPGAPNVYGYYEPGTTTPTGVAGAWLTDTCRAAGDIVSYYLDSTGAAAWYGNTIVGYEGIAFDENECKSGFGNCPAATITYKDNSFLGYYVPPEYVQDGSGEPPAVYCRIGSDSNCDNTTDYVLTYAYNGEYGMKSGTGSCPGTPFVCTDPEFTGEPAQASMPNETAFFVFDFYPSSGSPLVGAGTAISGLTTDYYGVIRPNPPTIGAAEPYVSGGLVLGGGIVVEGGTIF